MSTVTPPKSYKGVSKRQLKTRKMAQISSPVAVQNVPGSTNGKRVFGIRRI